jgi:hypothetical protein
MFRFCTGFQRIVALSCMLAFEQPSRAAAQEVPGESAVSRPAARDERIWLSDLPEQDAHVGWGAFGKKGRGGFEDVPIALNGIPSPHGLGTHPDATVTYRLDKKYRTFRATAAVNDSTPGFGHPVLFSVEGDGKPIWESRDLQTAHACQPVALDITGVSRLTLKTAYDPHRDGNGNWAHVVWLEPYVSSSRADPELVQALSAERFRRADERQAYIQKVKDLLYADKFTDLEKLAQDARGEQALFDGFPRMFWFYKALSHPGRRDEHWQFTYLERLSRWQKAYRQSCIPLIAAAWVWLDMATNLRDQATRPLGEEGWKLYRKRVSRAETFLQDVEQLDPKDTEFYAPQIATMTIEKLDDDKIDGVFDDALQLDPHYASAYLTRAWFLLPRNFGKTGDVGRLASAVQKRLGGRDGQIAYAQVALVALREDRNRYRSEEFDVHELGRALITYCREFAGSPSLVQEACRVACSSADFETARALFEQISPGDCDRQFWSSPEEMEDWRTKANSHVAGEQHSRK